MCSHFKKGVGCSHAIQTVRNIVNQYIKAGYTANLCAVDLSKVFDTRNSSGDEIANVNFLYDDIVHVLQNTIDSCIPPQIDAAVMCGTHVYQIQ